MNKKFVVEIGSADAETSLTMLSTTKLVEARDVYLAHKQAYQDCDAGQEVLSIKDQNGVVLYTLKGGFKN